MQMAAGWSFPAGLNAHSYVCLQDEPICLCLSYNSRRISLRIKIHMVHVRRTFTLAGSYFNIRGEFFHPSIRISRIRDELQTYRPLETWPPCRLKCKTGPVTGPALLCANVRICDLLIRSGGCNCLPVRNSV